MMNIWFNHGFEILLHVKKFAPNESVTISVNDNFAMFGSAYIYDDWSQKKNRKSETRYTKSTASDELNSQKKSI